MKNKTIMWLGFFAAVLLVCSAAVVSAVPGDNSDPVVTKSYIDKVIAEVKAYVDSKDISPGTVTPATSGVSSTYQVLNVSKGQKITMGESTEFILRAGNGVVFSGTQGGIADVTGGTDLLSGEQVPQNHLLIIPRSDGRGFTAKTEAVIMIRGSYQISE